MIVLHWITVLANAIRAALPKDHLGWHLFLLKIAFFLFVLMGIVNELIERYRSLFGGR